MLNNIIKNNKENIPYNLTCSSRTTFLYPKNYNELKTILAYLKKNNEKVLIKTGSCGHGDKSNLNGYEFAISLSKLNKIIKFNKAKKTIIAQAGIGLNELFFYLKEKGYIIFNIPGGRTVSLGGGIAGNVHGRPVKKNYENFGDNIISLKVMFDNGKIKQITKKNKIFYEIIGGLGLFTIILEAKLKVHKIENNFCDKITTTISDIKEFEKYQKNLKRFYGYINHFNKKNFEGSFINFVAKKNIKKENVYKFKKYLLLNFLFKLLNFFRISSFISWFINSLTLKIFYNLLFFLKSQSTNLSNKKMVDLEKSIYFIDYNQILPHIYRGGMVEIQFSIQYNKLIKIIQSLKKTFYHFNIFPFIFVLKKIDPSNKNYIFNFPKNAYSIGLTYPKKMYSNNKPYFKNLYSLLLKNKCNLYITKDETFIDNINSQNQKKYLKPKYFTFSKILSSDFKEKILKKIK